MTLPLQSSTVYGPVSSRRFGSSLGINISPTAVKFCLSNCIYCQYGWTDLEKVRQVKLRPASELLKEIEQDFSVRSGTGNRIDSITFSGNGEPTLHPELADLVQGVQRLRDRFFPKALLAILSDSTRVHLQEVRAALSEFDERYMKLDAGDAGTYSRINQPVVPIDWSSLVGGLKTLPDVTLQSLFISAPVDNSKGEIFHHWLETVREIGPKAVYVYTVSRPPADERVRPLEWSELCEIAHRVHEVSGSPASVF